MDGDLDVLAGWFLGLGETRSVAERPISSKCSTLDWTAASTAVRTVIHCAIVRSRDAAGARRLPADIALPSSRVHSQRARCKPASLGLHHFHFHL